jgi:hypothetical protein
MKSAIGHGMSQLRRVSGELRSGTFYDLARARARRRKSPYNLLLPLFVLPLWALLWWGAFNLAWGLHVLFYPSHAGLRSEFWPADLPAHIFIPSFMLLIPSFLPTLVWAMVCTNFVLHLVPPARRTFDREAVGYPGTDYRSAQTSLLIVAVVATGLCAVPTVLGAAMLKELR